MMPFVEKKLQLLNSIHHKSKSVTGPGVVNQASHLVFKTSIFFLLLLIMIPSFSLAQPVEYLLKAGFIEKFSRFTNWPDHSDANDPTTPFIISVIGKSPFEGSLEKIYTKAKIKNKSVHIRYISKENQIAGSHILFICQSEENHLKNILKAAQKDSVLVVSDTPGFGEKGSHINLYITEKGTLHFEINVKAAKKSGLAIQLILLEIAKIITT